MFVVKLTAVSVMFYDRFFVIKIRYVIIFIDVLSQCAKMSLSSFLF